MSLQRLAYFFGGMLAFDGLWGLLSPRSGILTYREISSVMPQSMRSFGKEYSHLSDGAVRYLSVWSLLSGLFILLLASFSSGQEGRPIELS